MLLTVLVMIKWSNGQLEHPNNEQSCTAVCEIQWAKNINAIAIGKGNEEIMILFCNGS